MKYKMFFPRITMIGFIVAFLLYGQISIASQNCIQAPNDLVAWWQAEGNANDVISANVGTLMNGTTFAQGKVGTAFNLDGINDYLGVPDTASLNFNGQSDSFTVEALIFRTSTGSNHVIYDKTTGITAPFIGYRLMIHSTDHVNFRTDGIEDLKFNCGYDTGTFLLLTHGTT